MAHDEFCAHSQYGFFEIQDRAVRVAYTHSQDLQQHFFRIWTWDWHLNPARFGVADNALPGLHVVRVEDVVLMSESSLGRILNYCRLMSIYTFTSAPADAALAISERECGPCIQAPQTVVGN